jgi:hypothetical protein
MGERSVGEALRAEAAALAPAIAEALRDANTNGPKCFHFVIGGPTPAALGADLLATIHDAIAYPWVTSPRLVREGPAR